MVEVNHRLFLLTSCLASPGQTQVTETWDYTGARWKPSFRFVTYDDINARGISRTVEAMRNRYAPAE